MKTIETLRQKNSIVRAVMYARFSSDMQREESIEAQVRAMRQFAEQNKLVIVGEYFDRAKSGTSADREEFQKLIADSGKRKFDLVLVHKVDRFARNRQDSIGARMQLKRNGVTVIAVAQLYDVESPKGMMMEAMLEAFAEYYSRNLASEVEKGKRENAMKGLHVGGTPPLGYDLDRDTMKLVINEQEAEAVRLIFKLALEGDGYTEIVRELRTKGYKTKRGNSFGKNSLFSILKNEKYTGVYVYSKSQSKDMDGKRNGHRYKDESEIIRIEGAVPSIINREDFDTVQELMAGRRKRTGSYAAKESYLLSGKVICGECKSAMSGNSRKARPGHRQYVSYTCTKRNASIECDNKNIMRDELEAHVLNQLSKLVFREDLIPIVVEGYNEHMDSQGGNMAAEMEGLESRAKEVQKKIDNLVGVIAQTGSAALLDGLHELETEKVDIENQLTILRRQMERSHVRETDVFAAFRHAQRMLENQTLENTKRLVQTFVHSVIVFKDHVEIKFNLGFDPEKLKESIRVQMELAEMFGKNNKDTHQKCVSLVGGEGGIRTLARVSTSTPLAGEPLIATWVLLQG